MILYLKKRKKANFRFFKNEGKKRKGSLVNYRSFAITSMGCLERRLREYTRYIPAAGVELTAEQPLSDSLPF